MCRPHDQFHYPADLREVASVLASGNGEDRDLVLAVATHDGLGAMIEQEAECMPLDALARIVSLMERHFRSKLDAIDDLKMRMHERWDTELDRQIAANTEDR